MPAGKGAGASPSSEPMSRDSLSSVAGPTRIGQPNTNSNTGMDVAPAGKGGGSSIATPAVGTPTNPYAQPQDISSFRNLDASGNPVNPMQVPNQYANTIGSMGGATDAMQNAGVGKGAAAGGSQGKGPQ